MKTVNITLSLGMIYVEVKYFKTGFNKIIISK